MGDKGMKMRVIDEVMNSPVSVGGFTWSYGFVHCRFDKLMKNRQVHSSAMASAQRHYRTEYFDTRNLSHADQLRMWNACGEGDLTTINELMVAK